MEREFQFLPHLLRVTNHDPEDFSIHFHLPAHKDLVVRRGSMVVDGVTFLLEPWREDAHAVHQTWMLHVRVVIEKLPMQLWNLEGAKEALGDKVIIDRLDSHTLERGDTKTFACWVWVWEIAHIPTRRTLWKHERGAGRVEEMNGFSPLPGCAATAGAAEERCPGARGPRGGLDSTVPTLLPALKAERHPLLQ